MLLFNNNAQTVTVTASLQKMDKVLQETFKCYKETKMKENEMRKEARKKKAAEARKNRKKNTKESGTF